MVVEQSIGRDVGEKKWDELIKSEEAL